MIGIFLIHCFIILILDFGEKSEERGNQENSIGELRGYLLCGNRLHPDQGKSGPGHSLRSSAKTVLFFLPFYEICFLIDRYCRIRFAHKELFWQPNISC